MYASAGRYTRFAVPLDFALSGKTMCILFSSIRISSYIYIYMYISAFIHSVHKLTRLAHFAHRWTSHHSSSNVHLIPVEWVSFSLLRQGRRILVVFIPHVCIQFARTHFEKCFDYTILLRTSNGQQKTQSPTASLDQRVKSGKWKILFTRCFFWFAALCQQFFFLRIIILYVACWVWKTICPRLILARELREI